MKNLYKNIILLSLIITTLTFISCSDISKAYCEETLNFPYSTNDSTSIINIDIALKCAEKYHKQPEFIQKISQIYYHNAVNDHSSESSIEATKKLYLALNYINKYFSKIENIKTYDYQFRGEIYERLGDIYKDINSLKQATALYDKALSDYENANNNEKVLNTLLKSGKLYQYNHMPNIAMIYFEMAEEKENIPTNIYRKIIDNKIVTLYELNDSKKADSIFNNHFNIKIQDYDYHSAIGTKYFYERNYDKALPHLKYCFENGNQQEKLAFSEKLAESYFNTNNHEDEMLYIQFQAKSNSLEIRKTPIKLDLEKLYDINTIIVNEENDTRENHNINNMKFIVLISTIFIFIIILALFWNKKQNQEGFYSAHKKNDANKETIVSKETISEDVSKKINDLKPNNNFEESYNRFCESDIYIKIKSSFDGISILTKNVHTYNKLNLSDKNLILIVKTFNNCFPNATNSLKRDFPNITTNDIKFIILSFMDLNDVEIAVSLGLTYGAANKRSNKIKNIFNTKDDLNSFLIRYFKSNF